MTAATAPPLLDPPATAAADLAPLLDDRERACEMIQRHLASGERRSCKLPAAWAVTANCVNFDVVERMLICEWHERRISDNASVACGSCGTLVRITWMELL